MQARVLENRPLGRGNRWLELRLPDQAVLDHEPGSVVGLALRHGQHLLRHAYTVSRCDPAERTLEFLYRVIPQGRMTPHLAALQPGAELTITGRGGHPIANEVATQPKGIVLVSTGTGIGPLYGYSQGVLQRGLALPLILFAGFRQEQDACLQDELAVLARQHPNFNWHFSLSQAPTGWTGLRGHVSESMGAVLGPVRDLHFHLVGNGAMVVELYEALRALGLEDRRVTSEIYFGWKNESGPDRSPALAKTFTF